MNETYYREKVLKLIDRIFVETGDAKTRIINCEDTILVAKLASNSSGVPIDIRHRWNVIWEELNTENEWADREGNLIQSSLVSTVTRKKNKTLEKYLLFFLEEFYRVI